MIVYLSFVSVATRVYWGELFDGIRYASPTSGCQVLRPVTYNIVHTTVVTT